KVEEIAEAVAKLPLDQLARFRRWFTAFEAGASITPRDSTLLRLNPAPPPAPRFLNLKSAARKRGSFYLITSSVPANSETGGSRPSALAVLRLITSSNFVDCITGRSPSFAPLRRPT